jgi:hypothetical protein
MKTMGVAVTDSRRTSLSPFVDWITKRQLDTRGRLHSIDSTQFDTLHRDFQLFQKALKPPEMGKKITRRELARRRSISRKQKRITPTKKIAVTTINTTIKKYYPERLTRPTHVPHVPETKQNLIIKSIERSVTRAQCFSGKRKIDTTNFDVEALEDLAERLEMLIGVRNVPLPSERITIATDNLASRGSSIVNASEGQLENLASQLEYLLSIGH